MSNLTIIKREYGINDAVLLQFCRNIAINLGDSIADFTAIDPEINPAYLSQYIAATDMAEDYSSDRVLKSSQAQITMDLKQKMAECRDFYQGMKYFITRAFPGKTGTWQEFGFHDYTKVSHKALQLISFMEQVQEAATKYAAQLAAVGFSAARLLELQTLVTELQAAKSLQEKAKGERPTATNERILLLNELWYMTARICRVSRIVYQNDYGRYILYKLPWANKKSKKKEDKEEQ